MSLPEVKHTRFFLTLIIFFGMFLAMILDVVIMIMKTPVDQTTFGVFNVIVGCLISMANNAGNTYYRSREAADAATVTAAAVAAVKAPDVAPKTI